MKTKSFEVSFSMKTGLPGYSSVEISVARKAELSEGDSFKETRQKVFEELKSFCEKETKKIVKQYKEERK